MRIKVWRSNKDKEQALLCGEGADFFEALPTAIRNLGATEWPAHLCKTVAGHLRKLADCQPEIRCRENLTAKLA
jgi:hypothetical protein